MYSDLPKDFLSSNIIRFLNDEVLACTENNKDVAVASVTIDSRQVKEGSLFVAISGSNSDGHSFIEDAICKGASLIIYDKNIDVKLLNYSSTNFIQVKNSKEALSKLLNFFFDSPSLKLKNIGITGTNGKTTTNWIIYNALVNLNRSPIRLGTLGIKYKDLINIESLTTPDLISIQSSLALAINNNCDYAVFEVSSHGLDQNRLQGIKLDVAVYTNLTQDHFDYHKNFENYYQAKKKIFPLLGSSKNKVAVINIDCIYGQRLYKELASQGLNVFTYSNTDSVSNEAINNTNKILGKIISQNLNEAVYKIEFKDKSYQIKTPILGEYNLSNFMASFATLVSLGFDEQQVVQALNNVPCVCGRLEKFSFKNSAVFVDYAHTPDGLENALKSLAKLAKMDLWVIFGCGGDRDKTKRPLMGKIAKKYATKVVVTSDNPRTEDPQSIIEDIIKDLNVDLIEVDRKKAIISTLRQIKEGDIVLIAGKGHEDCQIIGKEKFPFSDQTIVKDFILDKDYE